MSKKELIPEYKKELKDLENKMLWAQEFADMFPYFKKEILSRKLTKEFTGNISNRYEKLYLNWGINRRFHETANSITNYSGELTPQYLWSIYINEYALFGDSYNECDLPNPQDGIDFFFFDNLNSTFYVTDEQLMSLLNSLNDWYIKALEIYKRNIIALKRKELEKQMAALDGKP